MRGLIEGEKGKTMKKNAIEWKAKVEEAVGIDGSSHLLCNKINKLYVCNIYKISVT